MLTPDIFSYIDREMKALGYHDYDMEPYQIYFQNPSAAASLIHEIIDGPEMQGFYFLLLSENQTNAVGLVVKSDNRFYVHVNKYAQLCFMNYFTGASIIVDFSGITDLSAPIIVDFIKVQPRHTATDYICHAASQEKQKEIKSENFFTKIIEKIKKA